jgi:hypothetical protein
MAKRRQAAHGASMMSTDELRRRIHQFARMRFQGSLRNLFHFYSGGDRQMVRTEGLRRMLIDASPKSAKYMGTATTQLAILHGEDDGQWSSDSIRELDWMANLLDPGNTGYVRRQDYDRVFGN